MRRRWDSTRARKDRLPRARSLSLSPTTLTRCWRHNKTFFVVACFIGGSVILVTQALVVDVDAVTTCEVTCICGMYIGLKKMLKAIKILL